MRTAELTHRVFEAANVLRNFVSRADGVQLMSVMITLKWAQDHPEQLTVPKSAQWDQLVADAETNPRDALERAVAALTLANPDTFDGTIEPAIRRSRLSDDGARKLIDLIDKIPFGDDDPGPDTVAGRTYEQLLAAFTDSSKHAEVGTPKSVGQLMVQLANPQPDHRVYDPCVGAGGLLIAAEEHVAELTGRNNRLAVFGQGNDAQTCTIARLNLMLHGITDAYITSGGTITDPRYLINYGLFRRFDRVLSSPPFSVRYREQDLRQFEQYADYGVTRSADLMFVQHVLASLAPEGVGVAAVPNGVLFRGGSEGQIRQRMIEDGRIAAVIALGRNLFQNTSIPVSLLVLRGRFAATNPGAVMFIGAEHEVDAKRSKNQLAPSNIERIAKTYHEQAEVDYFSRLVPINEIAANKFNLNVADFIDSYPNKYSHPSVSALLSGGVPAEEVEAHRKRFDRFGIDLADLFVPGRTGYLEFPPRGYASIAESIPTLAAHTETAFITDVENWLQEFPQDPSALTDQPITAARRFFITEFQHTLAGSKILTGEQIADLFVDWWTTNKEGIKELRILIGSAEPAAHGRYASAFDEIGADLLTRAKNLVAKERNQLVETYRKWGEQYETSIEQLENEREELTSRLALQLRSLGYQLPISE
ncbi:N-6 DNA methylase [Nocardia fluminea]|uniref:N-6 DNA methylase n=1 Tax=Nocardia fluminea TaxID=134984 RepID=UPI00365BCC73